MCAPKLYCVPFRQQYCQYSLDGERRMQGKVAPLALVYCPMENLLLSSGVSLVSISVSSSPLSPQSYNTKSPILLFLEMPFKMRIPNLNISESGTYQLREEQCKSNVKEQRQKHGHIKKSNTRNVHTCTYTHTRRNARTHRVATWLMG